MMPPRNATPMFNPWLQVMSQQQDQGLPPEILAQMNQQPMGMDTVGDAANPNLGRDPASIKTPAPKVPAPKAPPAPRFKGPAVHKDEETDLAVPDESMLNNMLTNLTMKSARIGSKGMEYTQKAAPGLIDPSDREALRDWINQKDVESNRQQMEGIKKTQDLLDQYAQRPSQLDLSPLMGLADKEFAGSGGGKLLAGYKRPQSGDEKLVDLIKLQDAIQKERTGLSKTDIDMMKVMLGGQNLVRTALNSQSEISAKDPKQLAGGVGKNPLLKEIRQNLDKNVTEVMNKRNEQFDDIDTAFSTNDYQTIMSIMAQFARGVSGEKGVLTDQDIQRVLPRSFQGDVAKFKAYFANTPTAEMNPEYVGALRKAVSLAKQNAGRLYQELVDTKEQMYKADPHYDPSAQKTVDAVRGTVNRAKERMKASDHPPAPAGGDLPVGTRKTYQGVEYEYKGGGRNNKDNWVPAGK
jgi:hypothetical protein